MERNGNVTIIVDGIEQKLTDEERWALRQACSSESGQFNKRARNSRSKCLQEQHYRQSRFLARLAGVLIQPLPPMKRARG